MHMSFESTGLETSACGRPTGLKILRGVRVRVSPSQRGFKYLDPDGRNRTGIPTLEFPPAESSVLMAGVEPKSENLRGEFHACVEEGKNFP